MNPEQRRRWLRTVMREKWLTAEDRVMVLAIEKLLADGPLDEETRARLERPDLVLVSWEDREAEL